MEDAEYYAVGKSRAAKALNALRTPSLQDHFRRYHNGEHVAIKSQCIKFTSIFPLTRHAGLPLENHRSKDHTFTSLLKKL